MKPAWTCMLCHQSDEPHRKRDICDNCADGLRARGLAWCTRCRRRVAAIAMLKDDKVCKPCNAERTAMHYAKHRDERRTYMREYRNAHIEQALEKERTYRANNREKIRAQTNAYRSRNREQTRAYQRNYYHTHREQEMARTTAWRKANTTYCRIWRVRRKLRILQSWRRAA